MNMQSYQEFYIV